MSTYGLFEIQNDTKESKGHYVRIWKKEQEGEWIIILEVMNVD
jgi:ketosteroid isomerase-like protein